MEDFKIIIYKWESGCYDLKDLIKLVQNNSISKTDFFDITRFYFDKIQKKYQFKGVPHNEQCSTEYS